MKSAFVPRRTTSATPRGPLHPRRVLRKLQPRLEELEQRMLLSTVPVASFVFAPDTPQDYVSSVQGAAYAENGIGGEAIGQFNLSGRWTTTATDGGGLGQGDPTTLTWGILPDGVTIGSFSGEPTSPSNLIARLNGLYGSSATWLPIIQQTVDSWGDATGITFVYEPNDDLASFPGSPGVVGARPDIRIGGHLIDGNSGILAYNFFPNFGDMVIDTADSFYNNTGNNSIRLRNTVTHEEGHGIGVSHVCPVSQTKLMEPFISTAFDGPQFDDILAGNRHYGDAVEPNDNSGGATDLGFLGNGIETVEDVSVDDNSDTDFYSFTVAAGKESSVTLSPAGGNPYLSGPQNPNGSCSAGTLFDPETESDLAVAIIDSDGSTVLASADITGAGGNETLTDIALPGAGTYFVRVTGSDNAAQMYKFDLTVADGGPPTPADEFRINSGGPNFTDSNGDLFVADKAFVAGDFGYVAGNPHSTSSPIAGTTDDPLYQDLRFVRNPGTFSYNFDQLENGAWEVTLYFVEPAFSAGQRAIDVSIEGNLVLDDFDIAAAAGGPRVAHTETIVSTVSDGQLNIDFESVDGAALVSAIAVTKASVTTGTIVIEKQTIPDGAPDQFTFSGDVAGSISDGGQIVVTDLDAGTYTSTEAVPIGWDLTSIVCDDANSTGDVNSATATFQLEAGETVTCTFTNNEQINAFRINAGGNDFTASGGELFVADKAYAAGDFGFVGGAAHTFSGNVAGTTDDLLFLTMRADRSTFNYRFDGLATGAYNVELYFVEPWATAAGVRVFDVVVEGTTVLDNFDVFVESGGRLVAHTETFAATVSDGTLDIDFVPVNSVIVSGIAVTPAPATLATVETTGETTDAVSYAFTAASEFSLEATLSGARFLPSFPSGRPGQTPQDSSMLDHGYVTITSRPFLTPDVLPVATRPRDLGSYDPTHVDNFFKDHDQRLHPLLDRGLSDVVGTLAQDHVVVL